MTVEEVHEFLHARPFQPFRVVMSSGEAYEVRHPEMAMLTRAAVILGVGEHRGFPRGHRTLSLLHVTAIEPTSLKDSA
jgi:hypothetical protein